MSVADHANVVSTPATAANSGRVSYSLNLLVNGVTPMNEWGFDQTLAKQCHEYLLKNGEQPFILPESGIPGVEGSGILVSRRPVNRAKAGMAALLASA
jgi:hypothetical protein